MYLHDKLTAKNVLMLLGLTAAAAEGDAGIRENILGSGTVTLVISSKRNGGQYENSLLKNLEGQGQKERIIGTFLGNLGANLLVIY